MNKGLSISSQTGLLFNNYSMNWIKHFSFKYLFKLIGLTLILDFLFGRYHGLVSPGGSQYSPFLDQFFNVITWIRQFLMYTANIVANFFGTASYISSPQNMNIGEMIQVEIWYPCLGIGIMCFWTSFVLTNSGDWKKKGMWWISGITCICLINCLRISLLLVALDKGLAQNSSVDHHDLFNIAAYSIIGLLMYSYTEDYHKTNTFQTYHPEH